jgi:hypothetical protein
LDKNIIEYPVQKVPNQPFVKWKVEGLNFSNIKKALPNKSGTHTVADLSIKIF